MMKKILIALLLSLITSVAVADWKMNPFTGKLDYYEPGGSINSSYVDAPLSGNGTSGSHLAVSSSSTTTAGVVRLSDSVNSTSLSTAPTSSALKAAYDLANGKLSPTGDSSGLSTASTTSAGVMSAADKVFLNKINSTIWPCSLVCDGTTDDSTAINSCITAANNAGGATILLPDGKTCAIASTIVPKSYVTIDLNKSVLKWTGAANGHMVENDVSGTKLVKSGLINGYLYGNGLGSGGVVSILHSTQQGNWWWTYVGSTPLADFLWIKADVAGETTYNKNSVWNTFGPFVFADSGKGTGVSPQTRRGIILEGDRSSTSYVTNNTFVGPITLFTADRGFSFVRNCDSNVFTGWITDTLTTNDTAGICAVVNDANTYCTAASTPDSCCTGAGTGTCDNTNLSVWGEHFDYLSCQTWYYAAANLGKQGVVLNYSGNTTIDALNEDRPFESDAPTTPFWGTGSSYFVVNNHSVSHDIKVLHGPGENSLQLFSTITSTGTGDVTGPASATANHIPKFSDTSGKVLADGYATCQSGGASCLVETDSGGNIGINKSPTTSLDVASSSTVGAGNASILLKGGNNTERFELQSYNGNPGSVSPVFQAKGYAGTPTYLGSTLRDQVLGAFAGSGSDGLGIITSNKAFFGMYAKNQWTQSGSIIGALIAGSYVYITVNNGGSGYIVGDIVSISGGGGDATGTVNTVSGTAVTSLFVRSGGHGYSTGTNVATTAITGAGVGLTVDIGSVATGNDNSTYFAFSGTPSSSTTRAEWMRLTDGKLGIGTTAPDGTLEINEGTTGYFRLTYNDNNGSAANKTDFQTDSSGNLTVTPSGGTATIAGQLIHSVATVNTITSINLTAAQVSNTYINNSSGAGAQSSSSTIVLTLPAIFEGAHFKFIAGTGGTSRTVQFKPQAGEYISNNGTLLASSHRLTCSVATGDTLEVTAMYSGIVSNNLVWFSNSTGTAWTDGGI